MHLEIPGPNRPGAGDGGMFSDLEQMFGKTIRAGAVGEAAALICRTDC